MFSASTSFLHSGILATLFAFLALATLLGALFPLVKSSRFQKAWLYRGWTLGSFLLVSILCGVGYMSLGSPNMPGHAFSDTVDASMNNLSTPQLLARVESRLVRYPDDSKGWHVLAPIYMSLNLFSKAEKAYGNLVRLGFDDANTLARYGEAHVLYHGGIVQPLAERVFHEVLQKNSMSPRALYYLGLAAAQDGKQTKAKQHWQGLLARAEPGTPWHAFLRHRLVLANQGNYGAVEKTPRVISTIAGKKTSNVRKNMPR